MARKRDQEAQQLFSTAFPVGEEETSPAIASTPQAIENSNMARGTRTLLLRRDEMEIWEKNPRRSRTPKQVRTIAESMKADGQDETIIVRRHPDPEKVKAGILYEVITGGTRWEAAAPEYADFTMLRAEIRDLDDKEALKLSWRNNKKRNDMGPLDDAYYYLELSRMEGDPDSEQTLRAVAAESGVSKDRVKQFKDLITLPRYVLDSMMYSEPEEEQDENDERPPVSWNEKHGRALLQLRTYEDEQRRLFLEIKRDRLSGNASLTLAEKLLNNARKDAGLPAKPKKTRNPKVTPLGSSSAPPAGTPATPQPEKAPVDTRDTTSDATPALPPSSQGEQTSSNGTETQSTGAQSSGIEVSFQNADDALSQLVRELENSPLSTETANKVGFRAGRLRNLVNRITAAMEKSSLEGGSRI